MVDFLLKRWRESRENNYYGNISYHDLVESMGVKILEHETFGSYQGDIVYLVEDENKNPGILIIGYGSCSGCDALEAAMPYKVEVESDLEDVISLRDSLKNNIVWKKPQENFLETIVGLAQENYWWLSDSEIKDYVYRLALDVG
jgi:hypothetical protein